METDPEQTLDAIRNALSVADALVLQSHGSAASRQATDLLDPIAKGFVAQFFQNGQNMTSILLAQNMAQLSLEMKAPRVVTEFDSDPSTSNVNHDSTCDHGSDCDCDWNEFVTSWTSFNVHEYAAFFAEKKTGPLEAIAHTLLSLIHI